MEFAPSFCFISPSLWTPVRCVDFYCKRLVYSFFCRCSAGAETLFVVSLDIISAPGSNQPGPVEPAKAARRPRDPTNTLIARVPFCSGHLNDLYTGAGASAVPVPIWVEPDSLDCGTGTSRLPIPATSYPSQVAILYFFGSKKKGVPSGTPFLNP